MYGELHRETWDGIDYFVGPLTGLCFPVGGIKETVMAGVDEKEVQAQREQRAAAADLSATAIDTHAQAMACLMGKGFSHDYAAEQVRLKGADAVLEQKAAEEAPKSAKKSKAPDAA